ncbi:hypothetical protein E5Q_06029 [Mixia osmundae IAM 14324]|uniref:Uncharacterized protein n=1 Tax=Mixia osmundae (strain CBS 9802 / IAM 14324 / JCM 22182 / KY 12970) TaxID=764103 RepID=G7E9L5_MIXOS|nr:hypothetical protein E5Q_06029 [Mixia osmundae IAM 14324]
MEQASGSRGSQRVSTGFCSAESEVWRNSDGVIRRKLRLVEVFRGDALARQADSSGKTLAAYASGSRTRPSFHRIGWPTHPPVGCR